MNGEYLKHAHGYMDAIDKGVPVYQQEGHLSMARTLALLSIADSLVKLIEIYSEATYGTDGRKQIDD